MQDKNQKLELDMEQLTGSKLGKQYAHDRQYSAAGQTGRLRCYHGEQSLSWRRQFLADLPSLRPGDPAIWVGLGSAFYQLCDLERDPLALNLFLHSPVLR